MSSSSTALAHLRRIKPNDGWGIERKGSLLRLTRRNVPLTDAYFFDLHYDAGASGCVVGILSGVKRADGTMQSQVLIDENGKPSGRSITLLGVKAYNNNTRRTSTTPRSTTRNASSSSTQGASLSDAQNKDILKIGMAVVGFAIFYRVFLSQLTLLLLVLPLAYLYLLFHCPSVESFDAKKELKRLLRGHHLPENHPEKPKGFLSETLARIQATVATEIATLPGYEIHMTDLAGAAVLAVARVPAVETEYYWVGAANRVRVCSKVGES